MLNTPLPHHHIEFFVLCQEIKVTSKIMKTKIFVGIRGNGLLSYENVLK